jgi:hypothetical protein
MGFVRQMTALAGRLRRHEQAPALLLHAVTRHLVRFVTRLALAGAAMEFVLMPGAHDELAVETAFPQRTADVIAHVGDHAEPAVLERHGHETLAESCFAQRRALEIVRGADVDPFVRWLAHVHLPNVGRHDMPYTVGEQRGAECLSKQCRISNA